MNRYRKSLTGVLAVVSLLSSLLCSCSPSYPSESDARQVLNEKATRGGLYKITSFHKTDGQALEAFGVKGYRLDYEAEAECLRLDSQNITLYIELSPADSTKGVIPPCARVGEIHKMKGAIGFRKTENGWKPVGE